MAFSLCTVVWYAGSAYFPSSLPCIVVLGDIISLQSLQLHRLPASHHSRKTIAQGQMSVVWFMKEVRMPHQSKPAPRTFLINHSFVPRVLFRRQGTSPRRTPPCISPARASPWTVGWPSARETPTCLEEGNGLCIMSFTRERVSYERWAGKGGGGGGQQEAEAAKIEKTLEPRKVDRHEEAIATVGTLGNSAALHPVRWQKHPGGFVPEVGLYSSCLTIG